MEDINVLHICSYYYGSSLYKNLMNKLMKNKVNFDVFAPCSINSNYEQNEEYLIKEKCFNNIDRLFFYYKYNKVYKKLESAVDLNKYNLTHAHSLFSNGYISYKLYKKYNIPYVVAVRNTDLFVFFKYFLYLRKLGIEILENASKVIFISNSYKKILLDKYIPKQKFDSISKKCTVLPNGIDDYFFEHISSENKRKPKQELNLVFTGRVDNNKNLITTIKCCDKILSKKYNVKLTVIGKITSKKYEKIIKKYDFINYIGQKNKEEIIDIYKNMDIFVMPSKHETFGLTYVEAMSQGIPVIYTKNEGFDNFFKPGEVGYAIKYNNYIEMSQKIDLIIDNYEKISENCINNSSNFIWNDISLKYKEIYIKCLES